MERPAALDGDRSVRDADIGRPTASVGHYALGAECGGMSGRPWARPLALLLSVPLLFTALLALLVVLLADRKYGGPGLGLTFAGVAALFYGWAYRVARKRVQAESDTTAAIARRKEELERARTRQARGWARERLRIQEDWLFALHRERLLTAVGGVLLATGIALLAL
jgi:hypothetical protein